MVIQRVEEGGIESLNVLTPCGTMRIRPEIDRHIWGIKIERDGKPTQYFINTGSKLPLEKQMQKYAQKIDAEYN